MLDEPTSALDPATEHALFEGYTEAARRAGRGGAITVLVTHRFSTVSAADLVVVLADGRVSEVGRHVDLVRAGGGYARSMPSRHAATRERLLDTDSSGML